MKSNLFPLCSFSLSLSYFISTPSPMFLASIAIAGRIEEPEIEIGVFLAWLSGSLQSSDSDTMLVYIIVCVVWT